MVGMVGEPQLVDQVVRGSLGAASQIDDDDDDNDTAGVGSAQLCCGTGFLASFIPLKTDIQTKIYLFKSGSLPNYLYFTSIQQIFIYLYISIFYFFYFKKISYTMVMSD